MSPMPSDLRDRLRDESAEDRSELRAVWGLLRTVEDASEEAPDPESAWADLVQAHPELDSTPTNGREAPEAKRTEATADSRRRERTARRSSRRRVLGWGVALAVLVLVGGLWLWRLPVTVTVPAGQQQVATLPDGSTIELNSGTRLSYPRNFQAWPFIDAGQRSVQLEGEAFFDVADGERPFMVETANAQITVEGTQFNVWARSEGEPTTTVTMVEGEVRVASRHSPENSTVLSDSGHASQLVGTQAAPTTPSLATVDRVLAWRDDGFSVRARPLSSVVRELERRYEARVQIDSSVSQPDGLISLYYPGPTDLETILHDLCTARDLKYRPTRRGFEIFAEPDSR